MVNPDKEQIQTTNLILQENLQVEHQKLLQMLAFSTTMEEAEFVQQQISDIVSKIQSLPFSGNEEEKQAPE